MVDIVDAATRSRMMSGIRSCNTKPEILVRKALHKSGYRFRLDSKIKKIKPDIVLRKYKVAIFVHGCYWHQHEGCKLAYSDRNYSDKWKKKFNDNVNRDTKVIEILLSEDWRVAVIWECATRDPGVFEPLMKQFDQWIKFERSMFFESSYRKQ